MLENQGGEGQRPLCECHGEPKRKRGKGWSCAVKNREISRRWRENNPEKDHERHRLYRENNLEKERERVRRWRENNPEKDRERHRSYYENNREKKLEYMHNYRHSARGLASTIRQKRKLAMARLEELKLEKEAILSDLS